MRSISIDWLGAASAVMAVLLMAAAGLASCSDPQPNASPNLGGVSITLPDGAVVHAEVVSTVAEQQRGLMFRRDLAPDRHGLLRRRGPIARPHQEVTCRIAPGR